MNKTGTKPNPKHILTVVYIICCLRINQSPAAGVCSDHLRHACVSMRGCVCRCRSFVKTLSTPGDAGVLQLLHPRRFEPFSKKLIKNKVTKIQTSYLMILCLIAC